MRELLVAAVFGLTIAALYFRPLGAHDWQIAGIGGVVAWAVSPLGLHDGVATLADSWNILAFFLGLMLLAAAADASGLYTRAAALIARWSPVVIVLLLGTVITAILSNDATPLVLTPAVFLAAKRGFDARAAAFAVTFTADGASLLLPVSNPVNLLFYDRLDLSLGRYALEIFPAAAAGMLVLGTVVAWRSARTAPTAPSSPRAANPRALSTYGRWVVVTLPLLTAAYVAAALAGWPLGSVTLTAGLLLTIVGLVLGESSLHHLRAHVSPGLFVFVAGLLILVEAASSVGLFDGVGDALGWLAERPGLVAVLGAAAIGALLSNVLNNWPAALLLSAAIVATPGQPHELTAGALIGCTIGANLTMLGSLSTVFWMTLGRPRGLMVTPAGYAREAALPTLLALLAACAVAALTISLR